MVGFDSSSIDDERQAQRVRNMMPDKRIERCQAFVRFFSLFRPEHLRAISHGNPPWLLPPPMHGDATLALQCRAFRAQQRSRSVACAGG